MGQFRTQVTRSAFVASAGLMALAVAATASAVPITSWTFQDASINYVDNMDKGLRWLPYDGVPVNLSSKTLPNGVKLFSPTPSEQGAAQTPAFLIDGATYLPSPVADPDFQGNMFLIRGTGTIDGAAWQHPQDLIRTLFQFSVDFTGGELNIYDVQTGFLLTDPMGAFVTGVGSGGFNTLLEEPGGYGFGFAYEDRFGSDITAATDIEWQVRFKFDWTGQAPTDTLSLTIPVNSVDIIALPEPATLSLLGLGALAIRRRR